MIETLSKLSQLTSFRVSTYLVSIGTQGDTKGSGQTEISQLQVTITVDKQVLGFEVTVQDTVAMAVTNTLNQLSHELLHHGVAQTQVGAQHRAIRQGLATTTLANRQSLHVFLQIAVKILKDQVELVTVGVDNVEQLNDVGILHLLEQGDLADGSARNAFIFSLETDLLQGDDTVGVVQFASLVDDTVRS
jgi:hypothetical protein